MNLEANQAVQEVRFAGACLGVAWRKEINRAAETMSFLEKKPIRLRGLGPGFAGAWAPGLGASRALGPGPPGPWGRGLQGLGAGLLGPAAKWNPFRY